LNWTKSLTEKDEVNMDSRTDFNIPGLVEELDSAVQHGDVEKADALAALLFRLRGGSESDTVMPDCFPRDIALRKPADSGSPPTRARSIKKAVVIAAAAVLVVALGATALATHFFGLSDMVMKDTSGGSITNLYGAPTPSADAAYSSEPAAQPSPQELIALQGYPDSNEYKAAAEWAAFLAGYDTDHRILDKVGNSSNGWTEKYPTYLVYSKEMADKLEEITAKYGLSLHKLLTAAESPQDLFSGAGVGDFMIDGGSSGVNKWWGGYYYDDGTFQSEGEAVLDSGASMNYQFCDYVKGTFSDVYLNIGGAGSYEQWTYASKSDVPVTLALSDSKALVIVDLPKSFAVINILNGAKRDDFYETGGITKQDLENFADLFDFTQLDITHK
jgi:hypothetical protein